MEELPQQDGRIKKKFVLGFTTLPKEAVLNATNKNVLVSALGKEPKNWLGAELGLFTEPVMMAGKPTRGLRMRVLNKPRTALAPKPAPMPVPVVPDSDPPPDEFGSGPNPDDAIDFGEAAE
jgi:hypothetical protein